MESKRASRIIVSVFCLLCALLFVGGPFPATNAGPRNPCLEPGNLTHNCGFDVFVDRMDGAKRHQIPEGWWYYILSGDLEYRPSDDTYWGAPSLWMLSDGVPFTAGIYQQVDVMPGVVYQADIGWAAVTQSDFERKLGLDPMGGTDPQASTVVWGRSEWGMDPWPDLTVSTRATGPRMTVFVWVHHPTTHGNDWIFLDAVGLWPDPNQPVATLTPTPSPAPTRVPPTLVPSPVPSTDTPTPLPPSPTPTEAPSPLPTETQTTTPTSTPTWTATPSPVPPTLTSAPTWTPTRTPIPIAKVVYTPAARTASENEHMTGQGGGRGTVFLYVAGGAVAGAALLISVVLWIWIRARSVAHER
jgi:hypothetical protein